MCEGGGDVSEDASGAAQFGVQICRVGDGDQRAQVGTTLIHSLSTHLLTRWIILVFTPLFPPSPSSLVIDTLKEVDPSRKCFRLVGGVLVERTVKEVLPALETNKEQVKQMFW